MPGTYAFNSHPPYCQARFEVTTGGLPETGGRPASPKDLPSLVVIGFLLIVLGSSLVAVGAGRALSIRPRHPGS